MNRFAGCGNQGAGTRVHKALGFERWMSPALSADGLESWVDLRSCEKAKGVLFKGPSCLHQISGLKGNLPGRDVL